MDTDKKKYIVDKSYLKLERNKNGFVDTEADNILSRFVIGFMRVYEEHSIFNNTQKQKIDEISTILEIQ